MYGSSVGGRRDERQHSSSVRLRREETSRGSGLNVCVRMMAWRCSRQRCCEHTPFPYPSSPLPSPYPTPLPLDSTPTPFPTSSQQTWRSQEIHSMQSKSKIHKTHTYRNQQSILQCTLISLICPRSVSLSSSVLHLAVFSKVTTSLLDLSSKIKAGDSLAKSGGQSAEVEPLLALARSTMSLIHVDVKDLSQTITIVEEVNTHTNTQQAIHTYTSRQIQ